LDGSETESMGPMGLFAGSRNASPRYRIDRVAELDLEQQSVATRWRVRNPTRRVYP
jgi:hypothetical protein